MGNSARNREQAEENVCPMCYKSVLVPPHRLQPCQHFLCDDCLFHILEYNRRCPLCRSCIYIDARVFQVGLDRRLKQQRKDHSEHNETQDQSNKDKQPVRFIKHLRSTVTQIAYVVGMFLLYFIILLMAVVQQLFFKYT